MNKRYIRSYASAHKNRLLLFVTMLIASAIFYLIAYLVYKPQYYRESVPSAIVLEDSCRRAKPDNPECKVKTNLYITTNIDSSRIIMDVNIIGVSDAVRNAIVSLELFNLQLPKYAQDFSYYKNKFDLKNAIPGVIHPNSGLQRDFKKLNTKDFDSKYEKQHWVGKLHFKVSDIMKLLNMAPAKSTSSNKVSFGFEVQFTTSTLLIQETLDSYLSVLRVNNISSLERNSNAVVRLTYGDESLVPIPEDSFTYYRTHSESKHLSATHLYDESPLLARLPMGRVAPVPYRTVTIRESVIKKPDFIPSLSSAIALTLFGYAMGLLIELIVSFRPGKSSTANS